MQAHLLEGVSLARSNIFRLQSWANKGPGAAGSRPVQKPKETIVGLIRYFKDEKKGLVLSIVVTVLATGASVFVRFFWGLRLIIT